MYHRGGSPRPRLPAGARAVPGAAALGAPSAAGVLGGAAPAERFVQMGCAGPAARLRRRPRPRPPRPLLPPPSPSPPLRPPPSRERPPRPDPRARPRRRRRRRRGPDRPGPRPWAPPRASGAARHPWRPPSPLLPAPAAPGTPRPRPRRGPWEVTVGLFGAEGLPLLGPGGRHGGLGLPSGARGRKGRRGATPRVLGGWESGSRGSDREIQ